MQEECFLRCEMPRIMYPSLRREAPRKNMEYVFLAGGRKGRRRIFN